MVEVVRAGEGDLGVLAAVLARAFLEDPVAGYLFPDASSRAQRLRRFFTLQLTESYLPYGEILTTIERNAAALWMPPQFDPSFRLGLSSRLRLAAVLGRRLLPTRDLVRLLGAHHPPESHYYLGTIGTEPARQGQGIGSALLRSVLERCDDGDLPAYLECSRADNVAFYERHGFDVVTEVHVPDGGPRLWLMWRPPEHATGRERLSS